MAVTDTPTQTDTVPGASLERLREALAAHERFYPGNRQGRQPVHTVYGGAQLYRADSARKLGDHALRALDTWLREPADLATVLGPTAPPSDVLATVLTRVRHKLTTQPVEDQRVDFEDGYGVRTDTDESAHAHTVATELARGMAAGSLPPSVGIRVKPMTVASHGRALRTLDAVVTGLVRATGGALPAGFVVTLPKVSVPAQVATLADALDALERAVGLPQDAIGLELMVELPEALIGRAGTVALPGLVDAARGRCTAAHLGAYDLTAACGVTADQQSLHHGYCTLARRLMALSLAGRGIWLVDGATATLPVAPHRVHDTAGVLTEAQSTANRTAVRTAWQASARAIQGALDEGWYQGWDLHPAQIPVRYAVVYTHFLRTAEAQGERLRRFVAQAAHATQHGGVFDDAATGQGLLNFFLRGHACGAFTAAEVTVHTGLSVEDLTTRSFSTLVGTGVQVPR